MFRAPLCPSSGARDYYTGGCCLWYLVLWFSSCRYGMELRVTCPVCGLLPAARKAPNTTGSNHLYNTLELLMMGIVVPETCLASNKICNKNHLLHLVGILFPHTKVICCKGITLLFTLRNWTDRARLANSGFDTKYFKTSNCEERKEKNCLQAVRMSTKTFGSYQLYFLYKAKTTPYAAIGSTLGP